MVYIYKYKPINKFYGNAIYYGKKYNMFFIFLSTYIFFITAFRIETFGGQDAINYVRYFQGIKSSYYYIDVPIHDVGYITINKLLGLISKNEHFFIFIASLITLLPIFYGMHYLSGDKLMSLIMFLVLSNFLWVNSMTLLRQYFSISFIILAIILYYKNFHKYKYICVLLLILSCLIHVTEVLFIPLLLLFAYKKIPDVILYISLLFFWLLIPIFNDFEYILNIINVYFSFLDSSTRGLISSYSNINMDGGKNLLNMLPINILPAVMIYFGKETDRNRKLLQIFTYGICIYDLICSNNVSARMTILFYIIGIFSIPPVLELKKRKYFYLIMILLLGYFTWRVCVYYSFYTINFNLSNEPSMKYKFFFE